MAEYRLASERVGDSEPLNLVTTMHLLARTRIVFSILYETRERCEICHETMYMHRSEWVLRNRMSEIGCWSSSGRKNLSRKIYRAMNNCFVF